jgi:uncharacterized protein with von Willebrand factor type A (vWA) domain
VFVEFLYELRQDGVPVGLQEAIGLGRALSLGLHDSSLDGFYYVARSILIHRETHLDAFDVAFAKHFRGVAIDAKKITDELMQWLRDARTRPQLTEEERALLEALDFDEVERLFQERMREQRERHDGGNRFIGTGGTSPFGRAGVHPTGMRVGPSSGGKSAIKTADARAYLGYRSDLVLDVRQVEIALRKLRAFAREGSERELDVESTIDATAKNAGELEIVTRPPRRPNTRVILLMDVGGSMDPYSDMMSQLFSAAKRSTHWKELRIHYFHNCIYGQVYPTERFHDPVKITDLIASTGRHYKLVLVGDAFMAAWELLGAPTYGRSEEGASGIAWLLHLREHYDRAVWLNPEPPRAWPGSTIETIASIFPMFPLTLDGLSDAVTELVRGSSPRR